MNKLFLIICSLFISFGAMAGTINCGHVTLKTVYVQGDRDGGFHANKMLIILGDDKLSVCSNFSFAYLENTDAAYDGTLSMAMAAYLSGKKLRIQVENSPIQADARRIAWVNF